MPKHRHTFRPASWSNNELQFSCPCGELTTREPTKAELETLGYNDLLRSLKRKPKYGQDVHFVYHEYVKKFRGEKAKKYDTKYELMCAIEKWSAKYPKDIKAVHIDDSVHSSSRLFLIDHRAKDKYFGITVVVITQCDNQAAPYEFFLYPDHQDSLLIGLMALQKQATAVHERERKATAKRRVKIDKIRP